MIQLKNWDKSHYGIYHDNTEIGHIRYYSSIKKISYFVIYEEYQNKGYGQQALTQFLTLISERPIQLEVALENKRAIHIYQKFGFEFIGISPDDYLLMEKNHDDNC